MAAFPHPQWSYSNGVEPMAIDHGKPAPRPYSESVKRHLEDYDIRASLNEVGDASSRTLDLLRSQAARAHQHGRSGSIGSALPALSEIDEMIRIHRRSSDLLERVRSAVITHEHSLSEQRSHQHQQQQHQQQQHQQHQHQHQHQQYYKPVEERVPMYREDFKGGGTFGTTTTDSRKRRGKAAPPGRCHSCNRAETPEWRRGPDGARTLCNACGLHYAKLTRKVGVSKASSMTPSIRPRNSVGPRSPNPA